jgi:hypothetical protein
MTSFARLLAALIGVAASGCTFLPWIADQNAWHLHVRRLLFPGDNAGVTYATSIGLVVSLAATVVVLGALANSRPLTIIGGLVVVAVPSAWILVIAVSHSTTKVALSQIQIGAYGAAALGFMTLILAAVATDRRVPTVR